MLHRCSCFGGNAARYTPKQSAGFFRCKQPAIFGRNHIVSMWQTLWHYSTEIKHSNELFVRNIAPGFSAISRLRQSYMTLKRTADVLNSGEGSVWLIIHLESARKRSTCERRLFSFLSQTPVLLTPSPLPSTIHFWSTLSPIAPRSPAKLSFQVRIPLLSSAFTLFPASQHGHTEPSAASQLPALLPSRESAWNTAPVAASLQTRTRKYLGFLFQSCKQIKYYFIPDLCDVMSWLEFFVFFFLPPPQKWGK